MTLRPAAALSFIPGSDRRATSTNAIPSPKRQRNRQFLRQKLLSKYFIYISLCDAFVDLLPVNMCITSNKAKANSNIAHPGIDAGEYKLVETTVPGGYNKAEDIVFTVAATYTTDAAEPVLRELKVDPSNAAFTIEAVTYGEGECVLSIKNPQQRRKRSHFRKRDRSDQDPQPVRRSASFHRWYRYHTFLPRRWCPGPRRSSHADHKKKDEHLIH